MPGQGNRIILDTNLWISFLLTKDFSKLERLLSDGHVTILFSNELIEEFIEVTQRPKFRRYFSTMDVNDLLSAMSDYGELVDVTSIIAICRDIKDNFLLSLAKDGKATHLLTGDKDLLDIKSFGGIKIITLTDYLSAQ